MTAGPGFHLNLHAFADSESAVTVDPELNRGGGGDVGRGDLYDRGGHQGNEGKEWDQHLALQGSECAEHF
jgi:hypothetical protein